jgi:hypothetical protein
MLKVCFCAKQVDGLTASRQILTSKKDSIKPPIHHSCQNKVGVSTQVLLYAGLGGGEPPDPLPLQGTSHINKI